MLYPIEPLEEWIARNYRTLPAEGANQYEHGNWDRHIAAEVEERTGRPSCMRVAEIIGTSRMAVSRWRQRGIPEYSADKAACAAGVHPALLWPTWFSDATAPQPVEPAADLTFNRDAPFAALVLMVDELDFEQQRARRKPRRVAA